MAFGVCPGVIDLDSAITARTGEYMAFGRTPLELFDTSCVASIRVFSGSPCAIFATGRDEDAAVVIAGDEFACCFAGVGAPVEGVAFSLFVHFEGGGFVGGRGDEGAGGVEGGDVGCKIPDMDVAGFGERGGEGAVWGGADSVSCGWEWKGAGFKDWVVFCV